MDSNLKVDELNREEIIDLALMDLRSLLENNESGLEYAIQENIKFFQAAKSVRKYLYWLMKEFPKIDGNKLKEMADFGLRDGAWEKLLLKNLSDLERLNKIDLIKPLREEVIKEIRKIARVSNKQILLINLGCGGMEVERSIIEYLKTKPLSMPVTFIGIDSSRAAFTIAEQNLAAEGIQVKNSTLEEAVKEQNESNYKTFKARFVLGDASEELKKLPGNAVSVIYFSKFIHHLPQQAREKFYNLARAKAPTVIEFDEYQGFYLPILSLLSAWKKPLLLNGAVFSSKRVPKKSELRERQKQDSSWDIKITPLKGYTKTFKGN